LLRSAEFRGVYSKGMRFSSRLFTAFCLATEGQEGPKVGFTVPRALGNSVQRNRIKRRMREAVRLHLPLIGREWAIVFNPRRTALTAPFDELQHEVQRIVQRCNAR
ncbi:MAG: ribonuclease P protein component, partial [Bryobacteraceae bacterium]|nr:ribonuclease P protein component [Bryobacteraceae bacterium]